MLTNIQIFKSVLAPKGKSFVKDLLLKEKLKFKGIYSADKSSGKTLHDKT